MVRIASRLINVGVFVEVVLDQWVDQLRAADGTAELLAGVLRRAWRISVVQDGNGRNALEEMVSEVVNETGAIDACP
jgi:hypothetical protein